MKLSYSHHFSSSGTLGFQKFGKLLFKELAQFHDVVLVDVNSRSDIHLTAIHGKRKSNSKNVLRIDGVYYDKSRISMNAPISRCIKTFDGVIFQSKWSQILSSNLLGVRARKSAVIHNGTDCPEFKQDNKKPFDKIFVCCALWRVNKRLKTIVKAFLEAKDESGMDLGLYIIGKPDFNTNNKAVKYFGKVKSSVMQIYSQSDYMCHVCHLDACPNSVVEALRMGLPVLCNNIGGTPEIVGDSGVVVNIDSPFNFKYINSMNDVGPGSVDYKLVKDGMLKMVSRTWDIQRPDLDIKNIAKKYYKFFCSILG